MIEAEKNDYVDHEEEKLETHTQCEEVDLEHIDNELVVIEPISDQLITAQQDECDRVRAQLQESCSEENTAVEQQISGQVSPESAALIDKFEALTTEIAIANESEETNHAVETEEIEDITCHLVQCIKV